jgi:hypothetical protein
VIFLRSGVERRYVVIAASADKSRVFREKLTDLILPALVGRPQDFPCVCHSISSEDAGIFDLIVLFIRI